MIDEILEWWKTYGWFVDLCTNTVILTVLIGMADDVLRPHTFWAFFGIMLFLAWDLIRKGNAEKVNELFN